MAWERSFETRIQSIRKNELSWQARNYQIEVAFNCIWALTPVLGEADLLAGQVDCPRSRPNAMSDIDAKSTIPENEWIVSDMVAYVPQQAWLQNASIKDNVIFSSPWDPVRYQKVLEACSLISDLEILEDGDET